LFSDYYYYFFSCISQPVFYSILQFYKKKKDIWIYGYILYISIYVYIYSYMKNFLPGGFKYKNCGYFAIPELSQKYYRYISQLLWNVLFYSWNISKIPLKKFGVVQI